LVQSQDDFPVNISGDAPVFPLIFFFCYMRCRTLFLMKNTVTGSFLKIRPETPDFSENGRMRSA
jgi:hypothetical protein